MIMMLALVDDDDAEVDHVDDGADDCSALSASSVLLSYS